MGIEVTKDEGDQQQFDGTKLHGKLDENRHYRWVRKSSTNITRKKLMGYTEVSRDSGVEHVMDDTSRLKKPEDISTVIEMGDMILMSCPRERFEERQNRQRAKILRQTQGVTAAYRQAVARMSSAEGQRDLTIEEHRDTSANARDSVTESEFNEKMRQLPEDEGSMPGVRRR
jgi:hypothetical protein